MARSGHFVFLQHLFVFCHGQIFISASACVHFAATEMLRESLGEILVEFYPFTGRLVGSDRKMAVRCTGEGVPFVEAMSEDDIGMLGDISIIDLPMLRKLMNNSDGAQTILEKTFADSVVYRIIRVTAFKCGGITLGILINHVVIDGKALTDFITCWTDVARAKPLSIRPFSIDWYCARAKLLIAVNSRSKFNTPLPSSYLGTVLVWSYAECRASELIHKPFSFAVQTVHEALRCVTDSYIQSSVDHIEMNTVVVDREGNTCCISKWSRLPFYKTISGSAGRSKWHQLLYPTTSSRSLLIARRAISWSRHWGFLAMPWMFLQN
ncbi:omega-hydroxypalmitate O-feruloyl transferase-like [Eucalyptus grandis]|uniref:omega-hydroxypalmitate O-feruloyl transferase-like n=1 Tax=Eucalyptus grandis TaxID=71139 RepID=UPI00192E7670|nr:omega-hydroxypalmitate O-feruloyl transferase-like [Eucalyptus grandis]